MHSKSFFFWAVFQRIILQLIFRCFSFTGVFNEWCFISGKTTRARYRNINCREDGVFLRLIYFRASPVLLPFNFYLSDIRRCRAPTIFRENRCKFNGCTNWTNRGLRFRIWPKQTNGFSCDSQRVRGSRYGLFEGMYFHTVGLRRTPGEIGCQTASICKGVIECYEIRRHLVRLAIRSSRSGKPTDNTTCY